MVDKLAYLLLAAGFVGWSVFTILLWLRVGVPVDGEMLGFAWTASVVSGIVFLVGMVLLLVKVFIQRRRNREDDHYAKNVHK